MPAIVFTRAPPPAPPPAADKEDNDGEDDVAMDDVAAMGDAAGDTGDTEVDDDTCNCGGLRYYDILL
jgi:hypothetical protein